MNIQRIPFLFLKKDKDKVHFFNNKNTHNVTKILFFFLSSISYNFLQVLAFYLVMLDVSSNSLVYLGVIWQKVPKTAYYNYKQKQMHWQTLFCRPRVLVVVVSRHILYNPIIWNFTHCITKINSFSFKCQGLSWVDNKCLMLKLFLLSLSHSLLTLPLRECPVKWLILCTLYNK